MSRLITGLLLVLGTVAHAADDRSNILVIIADDIGVGDTGFSGGKDFPTPHIDRIAYEGAAFTAGYFTASVCSPSRAGYLSGRYQQRFGHELNPGEGFIARRAGKGPWFLCVAFNAQEA